MVGIYSIQIPLPSSCSPSSSSSSISCYASLCLILVAQVAAAHKQRATEYRVIHYSNTYFALLHDLALYCRALLSQAVRGRERSIFLFLIIFLPFYFTSLQPDINMPTTAQEAGLAAFNACLAAAKSYDARKNCREQCTLATCPLSLSYWAYRPSLGANGAFLGLFSLSLLGFLIQAILSRRFLGFTIAMLSGCVLEVIGYIGRIMSYNQPFQEVCSRC